VKYDVIIIGGGLGGLTAGAKLAKEGKKVLLIEQRHIPGGCATTFRRKDFIIEVSLAEMDGLDADDLKIEIFRNLGVFDHVELLKIPDFYRFTNERVDIVIPNNYGKAIEVLIRHYPNEEKGIKKFFKVILKIRKEINNLLLREKWKQLLLLPVLPILYPRIIFNQNKTLGNFLDTIIKNDYISDWENLSQEEYKAKKERVAQILIERLNRVIPGIRDEIEYYEVATPKTIKRYTLNPQGTPFGFAQIPGQAGIKRINQRSPIENLYFASAWTMPGGGFTGAILSGYLCAEGILRK
jgi:phytoene dehydrogenase-like protein